MEKFLHTYPQILSQIFHGIYAVFWIILLPGIVVVCLYFDYILILPLTLAAGLIYFFFRKKTGKSADSFKKLINRKFTSASFFIEKHSLISIVLVLMLLQIILQLYFGYEMVIDPTNDREVIFKQASEIALSGNWHTNSKYNYYFLRYPNNQLLLVIEAAYFMLLKALGITNFLYGNMVLNLFAIDLAVILCTILVYRKYGKKWAVLFQMLALLFLPFYTYIPFVYSDTLVLPVVAGLLLCYELLEEKWNQRGLQPCVLLLLIGVLSWLGYALKATAAIICIACFLHMIIAKHIKKGLVYSFTIALAFIICSMSSSNALQSLNMIDQTNYDRENFPYTHWVMMGLKGIGIYNLADRKYTSSFNTKEEKEHANKQMIKTRLQEYGLPGLAAHQYMKGVTTWHSGRYDMEFYLSKTNHKQSWLQAFFYKSGSFYHVYSLYCTLYHLFFLSMLTFSILRGYRRRELDSAVMWKLALFGLFLFLAIWETRPRYVMQFVPLLFLISIDMVYKLTTGREDPRPVLSWIYFLLSPIIFIPCLKNLSSFCWMFISIQPHKEFRISIFPSSPLRNSDGRQLEI